jgi:hypothetical protein
LVADLPRVSTGTTSSRATGVDAEHGWGDEAEAAGQAVSRPASKYVYLLQMDTENPTVLRALGRRGRVLGGHGPSSVRERSRTLANTRAGNHDMEIHLTLVDKLDVLSTGGTSPCRVEWN